MIAAIHERGQPAACVGLRALLYAHDASGLDCAARAASICKNKIGNAHGGHGYAAVGDNGAIAVQLRNDMIAFIHERGQPAARVGLRALLHTHDASGLDCAACARSGVRFVRLNGGSVVVFDIRKFAMLRPCAGVIPALCPHVFNCRDLHIVFKGGGTLHGQPAADINTDMPATPKGFANLHIGKVG